MRKALLVALRDYNAAVRTKGFIIGLLLVPVIFGGSIVVYGLTQRRVDTDDRRIAVVDRSGAVAAGLKEAADERNKSGIHDPETGKKIRPAYLLEVVEPDGDPLAQRLELSDRVRRGEIHAFLEIGRDVLDPGDDAAQARIAYHSENPVFDEARHWMVSPLNDQIRGLRMAEAGLDEELVERVTRWMSIDGLGLVTRDEQGQVRDAEPENELRTILTPYGVMVLMFILVMAAVNPLIHSALEEKMHRIAEVLLGSVRPGQLMAGKLLGAIGVSLTMGTIYIIAAVLAANHLEYSRSMPYDVLPWFAAYGLLALFMYGALFLAVGSACSDFKESQSLMLPLWAFVALPMFVWVPVVRDPTGAFATWLSLVPPFAPMLMVVRLSSPVTIPLWQPIVGLVGVGLSAVAAVWAAGRIFRVGILLQGKPPKLGEILRWAVRA